MLDSREQRGGWGYGEVGTAQRHTAKETLPPEDESLVFVWEGPSPSCWAGSPGIMTGLSQEVNDKRQRQRKRHLFAFCLQLVLFRFGFLFDYFLKRVRKKVWSGMGGEHLSGDKREETVIRMYYMSHFMRLGFCFVLFSQLPTP